MVSAVAAIVRSPRCLWRMSVTSLALLLCASAASLAQNARFRSIELCNGADRSTPEPQIVGCSALIASGKEPPRILSVAHNNRGNAYAAKGDYDRAIRDYESSIRLDPTFARAFNNRGVAYRKKEQYARAIEDFAQSIKLDPSYAGAFANRADAYQNLGEYRLAAADYDEAIKLQPDLEDVWNGRCWVRALIGELSAALSDCNKAVLVQPSAAVFDSRGLVHLKLKDFDAAIADYDAALRFDPTLAAALFGRGLARQGKGDRGGGDIDIAAARAIDPTIARQFDRYGVR
ncbi:MAG: tetratricopeptide repeat protein [Hyphomicrobiales bacterium]|nr:tetratricopeptide repeat protein [Hyphomicrobiales bacterium]